MGGGAASGGGLEQLASCCRSFTPTTLSPLHPDPFVPVAFWRKAPHRHATSLPTTLGPCLCSLLATPPCLPWLQRAAPAPSWGKSAVAMRGVPDWSGDSLPQQRRLGGKTAAAALPNLQSGLQPQQLPTLLPPCLPLTIVDPKIRVFFPMLNGKKILSWYQIQCVVNKRFPQAFCNLNNQVVCGSTIQVSILVTQIS